MAYIQNPGKALAMDFWSQYKDVFIGYVVFCTLGKILARYWIWSNLNMNKIFQLDPGSGWDVQKYERGWFHQGIIEDSPCKYPSPIDWLWKC